MASSSAGSPLTAPISTELKPRTDGRLSTEDRLGGVLWRFRAGAPMLGPPGVDAKSGQIYAGTTEGALHALAADGSFLWSYSLNGALIGAPLTDERGVVYVATSAKKLYAVRPGGRLLWNGRTTVTPATGLVHGPGGALCFRGRDNALHGVSRQGGLLWRIPLPGGGSFGPRALGNGRVLVGTGSGEVRIFDAARRSTVVLVQGEVRAAAVSGNRVYAIAGGDLLAAEIGGSARWGSSGFTDLALGPGGLVAVNRASELHWYSAAGESERHVALGSTPSAALAVAPSGQVFVPTDSGSVLIFAANGTLEREISVAHAPLSDIVLDLERSRLLVAAGDGTLAALSLTLAGVGR